MLCRPIEKVREGVIRRLASAVIGTLLLLLVVGAVPTKATTAADFYRGKQITLIISSEAGGGYDLYARLVAHHMSRFIPGNPVIVAQNMPGGAAAVAAQYMYNIASKDGLTIATLGQNLPLGQLLQPETLRFDMSKFNWIGNVDEANNVTVAWYTSGIKTIKDVFTKQLIIGAQGINSTSEQYPLVMNNVLGTSFRIVTGFSGTQSINLAMEQGEVNGLGSDSWETIVAQKPEWVRDKKIRVLVQIGRRREPDLSNVPLLTDLARNAAQREVLELVSSGTVIGRPILTTPGVPADRVQILRGAFDQTMKDPEFLAAARQAHLQIRPIYGLELQRYVEHIVASSPETVTLLKAALSTDHSFNCAALVKDRSLCVNKANTRSHRKQREGSTNVR
jgi:tripartite-type tricarboxylate transporter receptor subunit TctC